MNLKKIIIILIILVLIILGTTVFLSIIPLLTGKAIEETNKQYSHTKAICNESNFCQDYEIICEDNELVSSKPLTGAVIQHQEDWEDPREDRELCR